METNRRNFLKGTAGLLTVTGFAGCLNLDEDLESFHLSTDLDKMDEEVNSHEIYVNIYSHAESGNESIEEVEIQYLEPGEDTWDILKKDEAENGEASIAESYNPEKTGTYSFRSIAYTENNQYISDTEEVEVL